MLRLFRSIEYAIYPFCVVDENYKVFFVNTWHRGQWIPYTEKIMCTYGKMRLDRNWVVIETFDSLEQFMEEKFEEFL